MADEIKREKSSGLSFTEMREVLEYILDPKIPTSLRRVPAIWGEPSTGKSALIKLFCKEKGYRLVDYRMSTAQAEDLGGFPMQHGQMTKEARILAIIAKFITKNSPSEKLIDELLTVADDAKIRWVMPEMFPRPNDPPTMLFFDEANRGRMDTLQGLFQICYDKKSNMFLLGEQHMIAICCNYGERDNTSVTQMDTAFYNRVVNLHMRNDRDETLAYFKSQNYHSLVCNFIENNPKAYYDPPPADQLDIVKSWASPRSLEGLAVHLRPLLEKGVTDGKFTPQLLQLVCTIARGFIGDKHAGEFRDYLEHFGLVEIKDIINKYSEVKSDLKKLDRKIMEEIGTNLTAELAEYKKVTAEQCSNIVRFIAENFSGEGQKNQLANLMKNKSKGGSEAFRSAALDCKDKVTIPVRNKVTGEIKEQTLEVKIAAVDGL